MDHECPVRGAERSLVQLADEHPPVFPREGDGISALADLVGEVACGLAVVEIFGASSDRPRVAFILVGAVLADPPPVVTFIRRRLRPSAVAAGHLGAGVGAAIGCATVLGPAVVGGPAVTGAGVVGGGGEGVGLAASGEQEQGDQGEHGALLSAFRRLPSVIFGTIPETSNGVCDVVFRNIGKILPKITPQTAENGLFIDPSLVCTSGYVVRERVHLTCR